MIPDDNLRREIQVFGIRSIAERQQIILYELGMMTRSIVQDASSSSMPEKRAELANALVEFSDVVLQLRMLHAQLILRGMALSSPGQPDMHYLPSWDTLLTDGSVRQLERMDEWEYRKSGGRLFP
jgi:hypothetical protein